MNYLNSSLVNDKVRAKVWVEVTKVATIESTLLKVLFPYIIALLGVKSLFDSLKIVEPGKKFF